MQNLFRLLAEGGAYSLPYLLHLFSSDKSVDLYLINDTKDLEWNGALYKASNFTYTPAFDGSASLEIELVTADTIIDLLELSEKLNAEITGILYGGEVAEIAAYRHQYGEASWTGESLRVQFDSDDRLEMTFPALTFNSYNNRGNGGV